MYDFIDSPCILFNHERSAPIKITGTLRFLFPKVMWILFCVVPSHVSQNWSSAQVWPWIQDTFNYSYTQWSDIHKCLRARVYFNSSWFGVFCGLKHKVWRRDFSFYNYCILCKGLKTKNLWIELTLNLVAKHQYFLFIHTL